MSAREIGSFTGDEQPVDEARPPLTYVEYTPGDHHWIWPTKGWALQAAVIAALGSLLIGVGIAILIAVS